MRLLFYYQILQHHIQFSKEIHCNGERLKCFLNILFDSTMFYDESYTKEEAIHTVY